MPETSSPLLEFLLTHEESFKSRARLASLYSDFRALAQTNPDGYKANVSAWCQAIQDAANRGLLPGGDLLTLKTGPDLLRQLQLEKWGMPAALGSVIRDASAKGELIPLKDFLSQQHSIYSRNRVTPWRLASWAVTWGLQQVGLAAREGVGDDKLATGEFVIKPNVETAATALMAQLQREGAGSGPSLIYSKTMVITSFGHCYGQEAALSERDVDVLLTHMSRDLQQCSYDIATGTVRFMSPEKTIGASAEADPITENEIAIARLKTLLLALEAEVPALETKVSSLDKAARDAVSQSKTATARSALRSKKLVNETLDKRRDTLFQLQEVYSKIEAAHSNVEIVKVMEASAGVLRSLNQQIGGAEAAEKVVGKLRDEMETADEVNAVLGEQVGAGAVNEDEVDEEFEQMERAEKEKKEAAERKQKQEQEEEEVERTRKRLEELDKPRAEEVKEREGENVGPSKEPIVAS